MSTINSVFVYPSVSSVFVDSKVTSSSDSSLMQTPPTASMISIAEKIDQVMNMDWATDESYLERDSKSPLIQMQLQNNVLEESCISPESSEKLKSDEIRFFTDKEPDEWFPFNRDCHGCIQIDLTSSSSSQRLIYVFRNKDNNRLLIGKTGSGLRTRCSRYLSIFNKSESEKYVKKMGGKSFLEDMKKNPEHFEIGILYELKQDEDLDDFETLFIDYKRQKYSLYNDNRGGGGGLSHAEEKPVTYAIPNSDANPLTPEKYYLYHKDESGCIRPQFSPGFNRIIKDLTNQMDPHMLFTYVIKKAEKEKKAEEEQRYIGVTGNPLKRSKDHAYSAECCDPENDKFDPSLSTGRLHPALAERPGMFGIGILPIISADEIDKENLCNYKIVKSIAKVEKFCIKAKRAHYSKNGYNCNRGGGGPIPRRAKSGVRKKQAVRPRPKRLNFDK